MCVRDHLGNEFPNEKEMCIYHGVKQTTFSSRRKKGLSLKDCLSTDVLRKTPKGNSYVNNKGESFVISDYTDHRHLVIRFSDGFEKNTNMHSVKEGTVCRHPSAYYTLMEKTGEEMEQECGVVARILEARDLEKGGGITVEFLDDHSKKDCSYRRFREGKVSHPNQKDNKYLGSRKGEKRRMKCGLDAQIIEYRNANDMDVLLSDNTLLKEVAYKSFAHGVLKPATRKQPRKKIGDVIRQASGLDAELLSKDKDRCTIRLSNGNIINSSYASWRKGRLLATEQYTARKDPDELIGVTVRQNCGLDAKVIAARRTINIDICFEDGTKVCHVMWSTLQNGQVCHPSFKGKQKNIEFHGFLLKEKVYEDGTEIYYSVSKDGKEDILSLHEIINMG